MSENRRARILIVDDRPENLLALEAILVPLGHELVRAYSGPDALRALLRDDFAVILLDVQMPGMNGFETVELIKARERTRHIPVIFLTAISKEDQYVFHGYSVGAVDYMFKPLQPDILRSKVSVFVDLHLKNQQLREQEHRLHDARRRELEQRYTLERLESEARFSDLLASATDAIVAFDEHNRITLFNTGAEKIFELAGAQAIDTSVLELFHPTARSGFARMVAQAGAPGRRPGGNELVTYTAVRGSGEEFPLECSISSLQLRDAASFTLIGRDITERLQAERSLKIQAEQLATSSEELQTLNDELQERQQELERAMGARSRFYNNMSHELRTPINAVLGYSSLLLDGIYGPLNEEQIAGVERTKRAAKHLLELVNDVLDLSKIEAGKVDLLIETVKFPDVIEDLFVTVTPAAEQQGSTLQLFNEGDPVSVVTDPRRLRQILLNLLSNAIKFGKGKPITVRCKALSDGGVSIDVCDHGDGIPAEEQDAIFDEFVQLGKNRTHEGTGLGLPISRRLAQLLRGSLTVQSDVGKGSVFTVRLPAALDSIEAPSRHKRETVTISGD
ncbi:MAG TPA: ATP-binding protein [Longimicrobiales bacterium]